MADAIDGSVLDTLKRTMETLEKDSKRMSLKVFDETVRKLDGAFRALHEGKSDDLRKMVEEINKSKAKDVINISDAVEKVVKGLRPTGSGDASSLATFFKMPIEEATIAMRKMTAEGKVSFDILEISATQTRKQLKDAVEAENKLNELRSEQSKLQTTNITLLSAEEINTLNDRLKNVNKSIKEQTLLSSNLNDIKQKHILSEIALEEERFGGLLAQSRILTDAYSKQAEIRRKIEEEANKTWISRFQEAYGLENLKWWQVAIAGFVGGVNKFVEAIRKYKEKTATSYTQAVSETAALTRTGFENLTYGISPEKTVEAASELTNFLGSASNYSTELVTKSAKMSRFYGLSADESAALLGNLKNVTGGSEQLASDAVAYAGGLALANKVPVGKVLKEAAKNSGQLSTMSKSMRNSFLEASVIAGKMGISISDIAEKTKGMLDFEGTLEKQNQASIMLGKQINLIDVQRSRNARDMKGTLLGIKDIVDNIDLSQLSQIQLDSLQSALGGITEEQIQKIKSTSKTSIRTLSEAGAKSLFTKNEGTERLYSVADGSYEELKKIGSIVGKIFIAMQAAKAMGIVSGGGGGMGALAAGGGMFAAGGKFGKLGGYAKGIGGGVGVGSAVGAIAGTAGMDKMTSAVLGGLSGAITGALMGGGITPAAIAGALIGGATGAYTGWQSGTNKVPENGQAVSNIENNKSESVSEAQKTTSDELKPLMSELTAAIRGIPSAITVTGNVEIDGYKLGKWINANSLQTTQKNKGLTFDIT